jgi:rare lipoprotein A (peptidoglycan hydrolase)
MAKADTLTEEEKPKRRTRKKTDETAAGQSQPDAAAKKRGSKTSKPSATEEASAASADAKASDTSASSGALDPALLPARQGKVGVFGGPKDRGIKPDDKLALPTGKHFTFERVRSLNPKSFYCAMRWDYHVLGKSIGEGQRWWANKKLLVTNPANGAAVVVRAVDFGPPESTGLAIAVSPGAADALGVNVGDDVEIAFADPRLPTGAVE